MTGYISVHITTPTRIEADKIARALVDEKLAACVTIFPDVRSVYRWHGAVQAAHEFALMVKTRADLFDALAEKVKSLHSDACPCIVAAPITAGYQPYLDWITQETTR
jgi:periplasmic divalent cation tolerance protein